MAALSIPSINQQNAQHSTGPRTEAGKERVRLNAFKHGIYAKILFLPGDDQQQFEARRDILNARYQPQTDLESALVEHLHETEWRMARLVAIEITLLTVSTQENLDKVEEQFGPVDDAARRAIAQAIAYRENARTFGQISREESRLARVREKTQDQLEQILDARQPAESVPESVPAGNPGFVPPTPVAAMPHFSGPMADIKRKQWIRQQATRNALK